MSTYRTDEAFGIVPLWVTEAKLSDRAVRLYALLSGLRDYGTDMATVGRKALAKKLNCSDDSLDRAKSELEKVGALTVERGRAEDWQIAPNVYTIHRVRAGSRTGAARGVRVAAPERQGVLLLNERSSSPSKEKKSKSALPIKSVAGKPVTAEEYELARSILEAFNEVSGRRFTGQEWLRDIVRVIRDNSDVTLDRHREIIRAQFERPWWKGDPTPGVIYGNGKVFDRALNDVSGPARREPRERYSKI